MGCELAIGKVWGFWQNKVLKSVRMCFTGTIEFFSCSGYLHFYFFQCSEQMGVERSSIPAFTLWQGLNTSSITPIVLTNTYK